MGHRAAAGAEWRAGVELGPRPALLARREALRGGWITGVGVALGAGEDAVQLRAMPGVRLGCTPGRHLRLTGARWTGYHRLRRVGIFREIRTTCWTVGVPSARAPPRRGRRLNVVLMWNAPGDR